MLTQWISSWITLPFWSWLTSLGYKVMLSLQLVAVLVIIGQKLYYDGLNVNYRFAVLSIFCVFAFCATIPWAMTNPTFVGHCGGWIMLILFVSTPLPQIIKFFIEKRSGGFSFNFVFIVLIASLIDVINVYMFSLPFQTLLIALKNPITYGILSVQVLLYRK